MALTLGLIAGAASAQATPPDGLQLRTSAAPQSPANAPLAGVAPDAPLAGNAEDATPLEARPEPLRKLKPKPRADRLPALEPYPGAQRLGRPGGPPALRQGETPPPTVAALPPPPPRRRLPEDDKPFEPVGVRFGDFKMTPAFEEDLGWASNPGNRAGPTKGSGFSTTQGDLKLDSDWSTSALSGDLRGGFTDYFADRSASAPFGEGLLKGRYDASRDLSFDAEGRFDVSAQTQSSLGLPAGVGFAGARAPLVETAGATLGAERKFGKLALSLHGALDRTANQDARLSNGVLEQLSSDNFNDWGLKARAAFEVSPEFKPFVEAEADARRYDAARDASGFARNSDGVIGRLGVDLEFTRQLTGEFALGYGARDYQDSRLPRLESPLLDASLVWSATALTTVTLKAKSSLADTTIAGASGAATHAYTIEISHDVRRNFALLANAGVTTNAYVGSPLRDSTASLSLGANYSLNRDVVLKASASRQFYTSNAPLSNYAATVLMLGLRLQR